MSLVMHCSPDTVLADLTARHPQTLDRQHADFERDVLFPAVWRLLAERDV